MNSIFVQTHDDGKIVMNTGGTTQGWSMEVPHQVGLQPLQCKEKVAVDQLDLLFINSTVVLSGLVSITCKLFHR